MSADRFVSALERGRVLPLIRTDSAATAYDQATAAGALAIGVRADRLPVDGVS